MSKIKEIIVVSQEKYGNIGYKPVAIDSLDPLVGEKALSMSFLLDSFRKVMGRTLTTIDASITDKGQNKAIKDIIRGIFSDELEFASDMVYDQNEMEELANESFEALSEEEQDEALQGVGIEEVLNIK